MPGSVHAIRRCGRPWPSGRDARKRKGCISCLGCSSPDALIAAHHDRDARSPFRTAPTANHACGPCRRAALWRTQRPWQRRALCWRAAALQIQGGHPSAAAPPQRLQRTAAPPPCLPPPPPALRCASRLHALQIHPATGHRRHARAPFVSSCTTASPVAPPPPPMRGRGGVTSRSGMRSTASHLSHSRTPHHPPLCRFTLDPALTCGAIARLPLWSLPTPPPL